VNEFSTNMWHTYDDFGAVRINTEAPALTAPRSTDVGGLEVMHRPGKG
jgi:hypothetical protein